MNRRRQDPTPWGITATGWQAVAFLLLGLIALTNAAWFYTARVAKAEAAAAAAPAASAEPIERVIYQTPDGRLLPPPRTEARPERVAPPPLAPDERCINGTRFRSDGNGFVQLQTPC